MLERHPRLLLLTCVLLTVITITLKIVYHSYLYFNPLMILTIMLTIGLSDFLTRLFTVISIIMVVLAIVFNGNNAEVLISQCFIVVVMLATAQGVIYIKRLYKSFRQEKQQMSVLIAERAQAEENLIVQKDKLEKITHDIRRLNASLENKVEERTLILKEALQELERSQLELSEALNKEKELNDIKSRFVSMASHEFRTPLSTILSSSALVAKYPLTEDQDKRDKHLLRIKDSVKHLNDLLGDFLSLGKLEEGKVSLDADDFNAREYIQDVCDEMKPMLKPGQGLLHAFKGQGTFCTDKRLLKNILINLISNAVKFSGEGSSIFIEVDNKGSDLIIHVKDEGIGIPEEDMQHLFTSFFRGKNAINIEGTGLGLSIVKRYAELINGKISVSSATDKGTIFSLNLPLLRREVSDY